MRKNTHIIKLLILFFAFAFTVFPSKAFSSDSEGSITVGFITDNSNMMSIKDGNRKYGYYYEYLQRIAYINGWKYDYVYDSWADLLDMIKAGEIDILPTVAYTPERAGFSIFSKEPVSTEGYYFYTLYDNFDIIPEDYDSYKGKKIGYLRHSIEEKSVDSYIKENGLDAVKVEYDSYSNMRLALLNGEVDAIADVDILVESYEKRLDEIGSEPTYFIVNINRPDIAEKLDSAMGKILAEDKYYQLELYKKYISDNLYQNVLDPEEEQWYSDKENIRIGCLVGFLPISDISDIAGETRHEGFLFDYLTEATRVMKIENNKFEYRMYSTYDKMTEALHKGEVDAIFPALTDFNTAENEEIFISDEIVSINMVAVIKGGMDMSKFDEISLFGGTMSREYASIFFSNSKQHVYNNKTEVIDAVENGETGAAIVSLLNANKVINGNKKYADLITIGINEPARYSFAATKDNLPLLSIINKANNMVTDDFKNYSMSLHTADELKYTSNDFFKDNAVIIVLVVLTFIAMVSLLILLSQSHVREKLQLKKLEETSASKSRFLFNMSHDIRTPMNAIIGFTELAKSNLDDKEKVRDYLNKAKVSGEHLLGLINDVLDMARIENGKISIDKEPTDLETSAHNLEAIIRPMADQKCINLFCNIGDLRDKVVYCDELHVNQILLNVLSNAVKFTAPGGDVIYSLEQTDDYPDGRACFIYTMTDTGIGMSEDFVEHIFDEFSRERTSTQSGIQGTGLGMSIANRLTELMDGTIKIESKQGQGTKVICTLPFEKCDLALILGEDDYKTEQNTVDIKGKKLLLVEDNEFNREIAKNILENSGLYVEEAENGSEAVDKIKNAGTEYYDYVLMDVQMPVMDGLTATRVIRDLEGEYYKQLPIIAMTANAFEEDRKKTLEAGMNEHLAKPISVEGLMDALKKFGH